MIETPNKRAGGDDGIPVLFHVVPAYLAAPQHESSA
jgi:hypothetical protein